MLSTTGYNVKNSTETKLQICRTNSLTQSVADPAQGRGGMQILDPPLDTMPQYLTSLERTATYVTEERIKSWLSANSV